MKKVKHPIYKGLIFGLALYIILMKTKKEKPCLCPKAEPAKSIDIPVSNPSPPPMCIEKPFVLYKGMEKHVISWLNGKPQNAIYTMVFIDGLPQAIPKTASLRYEMLSVEKYSEYCEEYMHGEYRSIPKPTS